MELPVVVLMFVLLEFVRLFRDSVWLAYAVDVVKVIVLLLESVKAPRTELPVRVPLRVLLEAVELVSDAVWLVYVFVELLEVVSAVESE
jgi:hypothetical protein